MAEYSKKITALGDDTYGFYFSGACAGCNAFTVLPYIWASGGDVISEDGKTATVTDPVVKSTLEFLHQMYVDKQIPESSKADTGTEFLNIFTSGKIGMVGSGAFSIATLKAPPDSASASGEAAASPQPQIDFGIAPLPGKDGGSSSFAGGDTIAIPASSKRPKEAFEFIEWFLSDEVQIEQLAKNGGLPLRSISSTTSIARRSALHHRRQCDVQRRSYPVPAAVQRHLQRCQRPVVGHAAARRIRRRD
jgi:multiple sugar transport system substrate-binding protein